MLDEAIELATMEMESAIDSLHTRLAKVRAGRANPAILDDVRVDSYGSMVPLKQVSTVSIADARLLVVKPWDRNMVPIIERSINNSQLGLNASNDGMIVRVPVPSLTEERRKDLVKKVKDLVEEAKISCRHARRDANDMLKKAEKDKDISEDDCKRGLEEIQKVTDGHIKKIDAAMTKKQKEILEV
ncbi:MAG: ribosome recycling factor [Nannocystaceae bacterium]